MEETTQSGDLRDGFDRARACDDDVEARLLQASLHRRMFSGEQPTQRYRIEERIGSGGEGVVFAAHDTELDRRVALKFPRADPVNAAQGEIDEELRREAEALALLSHPNVVPVFDVGLLEGRLFIAMELVSGTDLAGWLRRGEHRVTDIVAVFVQAGRGLAAAHAAGLVHRDFKPKNVLVGDDGRVRVTDFGLATSSDGGRSPRGSPDDLTDGGGGDGTGTRSTPGFVSGTPPYLAPEQHLGRPATDRSDQFSFCVSLYEALFGVRPFTGHRSTLGEQKQREQFTRPSGVDVPGWLWRLVARGLSAEPDRRFPSMAAVVEALERRPGRWVWRAAALAVVVGLGGGAVALALDAPVATCGDGGPRVEQVWGPATATEVRETMLGSGLPYAAETWVRTERALDAYAVDLVRHYDAACESTAQNGGSLDASMACFHRGLDELDATVQLLKRGEPSVVERAVQTVHAIDPLTDCREDPLAPLDAASIEDAAELRPMVVGAEVALRARRLDEALALAEAAAEAAQRRQRAQFRVEAEIVRGIALGRLGRREDSIAALTEAYFGAKREGYDHLVTNAALNLCGTLAAGESNAEEAMKWYRHAKVHAQRLPEDDPVQDRLLSTRAQIHHAAGEFEQAQALIEQALTSRRARMGPDHPSVQRTIANLALAHFRQGHYDQAAAHFAELLELREQTYGPSHPEVARLSINHGAAVERLGRLDEALHSYDRATAILDSHASHRALAPHAYINKASVLTRMKRFDEALASSSRAIDLGLKYMSDDDVAMAGAYNNRGKILGSLGKYEQALSDFQAAKRRFERLQGATHPNVAMSLANIAETQLALEQPQPAIECLEQALKIRAAHPSLDRAEGAQVEYTMAYALWDRNEGDDRARAIEWADRAVASLEGSGEHLAETRDDVARWVAKRRDAAGASESRTATEG